MKKLKWTKISYGYREAVYRNHSIYDSNGEFMPDGITVDFDGDLVYCEDIDDARDKIDEYILWELREELQRLGKCAAGFKVSYENEKFILINIFPEVASEPLINAMNEYVHKNLSEAANFMASKDSHWVLKKF